MSGFWPDPGRSSEIRPKAGQRLSLDFLDAAPSVLFAYVELESPERWNARAATEVCRRWWVVMRDLMETHVDASPVSEGLVEVFCLST